MDYSEQYSFINNDNNIIKIKDEELTTPKSNKEKSLEEKVIYINKHK